MDFFLTPRTYHRAESLPFLVMAIAQPASPC
ncbi:hypothetical protein M878_13945 [Streptomyces roseochromogenus subsp. oscitans DS 12.976]|uniref:Uncharacterized protein n=1 Tax=Streptomyces roseochromogenus subsp. oscitans DS 12.976 TaxID=1352936 RepID=V6KN77_STRRC|nr:hypothetical protein M878_13945 [Streptomyces roseochromogenus subsp. oscitans DS 12.976]